MKSEANEIELEALSEILYFKKSVPSVCSKFKLYRKKLERLMKLFKRNFRKLKADNRRFHNKRKKLQEDHIEFIRSYCEDKKGQYFTLENIKIEVLNRFKDLSNLSLATISAWLKRDLNLRFKKTNKVNLQLKAFEKQQLVLNSISIQIKLEKVGYNIIYLDEFKYCSNSNRYLTWSKPGKNSYLFQPTSYFDVSFIVAFSSSKIELLNATRTTYTAEIFVKFVYELSVNNPSNLVIIMDNAPIHKSEKVEQFWKTQNILMLTIPAYWPFLNPWEKLILKIKSTARKFQRQGKLVTLQTFKSITDSISSSTLQKWITESKLETYNFIKDFIIRS